MLTGRPSVNRDIPFGGLHWMLDHAETISDRNIERVQALGGGIAVQHRMAFQGEYFVERYGAAAADRTPPIQRILAAGVPLGAGTDATRVANYNPWDSLYWLVSGRTMGGLALYPEENRLSRMEALRLYTVGSAWFANADGQKGAIVPGQLADLAVLSADFFSIPEPEIRGLASVLTVLGGKVVWADDAYSPLAPPPLPVTPDWSPVAKYGGYGAPGFYATESDHVHHETCGCGAIGNQLASVTGVPAPRKKHAADCAWGSMGFFGGGCDCFAF